MDYNLFCKDCNYLQKKQIYCPLVMNINHILVKFGISTLYFVLRLPPETGKLDKYDYSISESLSF
jgi:hypothetical protein